jgi:hypothetical protein
MATTERTEQIVREAKEIEDIRIKLLESAKAAVDAPPILPDYRVAGFTDEQIQALQAGVQGIGAYLPFMQSGAQALGTATGALGESADILRGADTRGQFEAAQQAMNLAAQPAAALGDLANVAGSGMGLIGAGAQGIDVAQQMAQQYAQANMDQSMGALGQAQQIAQQTGPSDFGVAAGQLGQASGTAGIASLNAQLAAMRGQPGSFVQPGTAEQFMSPYMQQVVGIQQREAQRQADIAGTQRGAQAVRAGAFGGSRQAIMDAEAQRNLAQQMGDIQATGSQSAFQQAQAQFNQEQQARQAGSQLGLAASAQQLQQAGFDANTAMQLAQLQQTQQQQGLQQAQALQGIGGLYGQQALQQAQLGQSAAGLTGQLGGQQAQLAQMYGNIAGQQANILGQQSQLQQGIGQGIGSLAGQQFNIGAQQAAGLGSLGSQLGNLGVQQAAMGQTAQQLGQRDVDFLFGLGSQQQRQAQARIDAERASEMQTAMQPMQNIAFLSDIYKGAPSTQMALTQQAQATPSPFQQIAGLGVGLGATAKAFGGTQTSSI